MAITRERKEELVEEYRQQLGRSQGFILTDYRGLRVPQLEQLRRSARDKGSAVQIVKNRLLKIALEEAGLTVPDEWLVGPTAVAFCYDELPPAAQAVTDFAKDAPLEVKGGVVDAAILSSEQIKELASLPSREVLLAQVLGTINAPATQIAGVVASGIRQVLNVLQAYVDKLEESSPAQQAEAEAAA